MTVAAIGMTMTEMVQANIEHAAPVIKLGESRIPMGRIGTTEDMDGIIIYLASDMSKYHTGDTITLENDPAVEPLPGYKPPMQMVFCDFYPATSDAEDAKTNEFEGLRESMGKLSLN